MTIWESYDAERRAQYVKSIQALGALSPLFRQKAEDSGDSEDRTAFISSKYQETAFAKFFDGKVVDRGNDPYDVMVPSPTEGKRDLVGIKTFLNSSSSMQKVMQFKRIANNEGWSQWIADGKYEYLIRRIAFIRNQKLRSTQNLLAGAGCTPETAFKNIFYHYLSPTKNGGVNIGETDYPLMDEKNLTYQEPKNGKPVTSIYFSDGLHDFKYTPADSTLYMSFKHRENYPEGEIVDDFEVLYLEDPHAALMRMLKNEFGGEYLPDVGNPAVDATFSPTFGFLEDSGEEKEEDSGEEKEYFVFPLFRLNDRGETPAGQVDQKSGFNVRFAASKNKKTNKSRPENEVEIRIPAAKKFHEKYPSFFGYATNGKPKSQLQREGGKWEAVFDIDERTFMLTLTQSGVEMEAYITGDTNKQIMSKHRQSTLGGWILSQVFQLDSSERLTRNKLDELGLDGIKLIRLGEGHIGMEFIKIRDEHLDHLWPQEPDRFKELATGEDNDEE